MGYSGKLVTYGVLVGGAPRFRPDRGFPLRFAMDDGRGRVRVVVVHTWQNKNRWQKSELVAKIHRIQEKSRLAQEEKSKQLAVAKAVAKIIQPVRSKRRKIGIPRLSPPLSRDSRTGRSGNGERSLRPLFPIAPSTPPHQPPSSKFWNNS